MICNVCSEEATEIFSVHDVPGLQSVFPESYSAAADFPRIDASYFLCERCGHISVSKSREMRFSRDYNNKTIASPAIQKHLSTVVDAVKKHCAPGARVLEIGCGRGELLLALKAAGFENLTGYDPAAEDDLGGMVVCDYWRGDRDTLVPYDVVIMRHALEEVKDPHSLIDTLQGAIGPESALYIEVTNATRIIDGADACALYPEYWNFFCGESLVRLLSRASFSVVELNDYFSGMWLGSWFRPRSRIVPDFEEIVRRVRRRIAALDGPVVVWGAGGRSSDLVNFCHIGVDLVAHVVDVEPTKWGRYVAGTGQSIISPDQIGDVSPKSVIVMNKIYLSEVKTRVPADCAVVTIEDLYRA